MNIQSGARPRLGIRSVELAGSVVRALLEFDGPAKLSDVAKMAGMPSAKVHRYLVSLRRIGLAMQDPVSGLYDLGPLALQLGLVGFSRFDLLRFAEQELAELAEATGETAAIAVWGSQGPAIIRTVEPRHELAATVPHGHVCPLTFSATGFVFCAYEQPDRLERVLDRELAQNLRTKRPMAPQSRAELKPLVQATRRHGVGSVEYGGADGTNAVSAPVFDSDGRLIMAFTVFGRGGRLDVAPEGPLAGLVKAAAQAFSNRLGHVGVEPASAPSRARKRRE